MKVQDVEQVVSSGRRSHACPYYASRHGVPAAQLVALPYQVKDIPCTRLPREHGPGSFPLHYKGVPIYVLLKYIFKLILPPHRGFHIVF